MIAIGLAFVLFWALPTVLHVELLMSAIVTGIVFIALGLLLGERSLK